MQEFRRLDVLALPSMKRDKDGFLVGEAVVTRTGIYKYKNQDGSIRNELRHPHDVFAAASIDTLKMMPIAVLHPPEAFITVKNAKDRQVGQTGEQIKIDGNVIIIPIKVTHQDAIEQIESGMRELSLGYTVQHDDLEGGTWDGTSYDLRQVNIRYNHLAIVPDGRAGIARLNLDATDAYLTDEEQTNKIGGHEMSDKKFPTIVIDSISYEASQQVINELTKQTKHADLLEKELVAFSEVKLDDKTTGKADASVIEALQTVRGEKDALQKKLDEAKKLVGDEAIRKAVIARTNIIELAKPVLDEETIKQLDTMTDIDIMKEVIVQSVSDEAEKEAVRTSLKDAADAYVIGSFDVVSKAIPDKSKQTVADQRNQVGGGNTKDKKKDDGKRTSADARFDMIEDMQKRSQPVVAEA